MSLEVPFGPRILCVRYFKKMLCYILSQAASGQNSCLVRLPHSLYELTEEY